MTTLSMDSWRAGAQALNDKELANCIERAEIKARVFDTAETKQWFAEMAERDANYMWLMTLRDEQTDRSRRIAA